MKKLIFLLLAIPAIASAAITGAARTTYLAEAQSSCFRAQRTAAANGSVGDAALMSYCNCTSIYTADRLTDQDAVMLVAGRVNDLYAIINAAASYCRATMARR